MAIKILLIFASVVFIACNKKPKADFTWNPQTPKVGQTVSFTNKSSDAEKYDWNLGNMKISSEKDPQNIYDQPGNFIIDLTAKNGLKSDIKTVTVTIAP